MATDPFDIAAQTVARQRAFGPIASTQYQDATKAARANTIARQIGLPADAVQSAFPDAEAEYRLQQGQALAATTPQAANWLSTPSNAAAVSNDYSGLAPVASSLNSHSGPRVLTAQPTPQSQGWLGSLWQGTKSFVGGLGQTLTSSSKSLYANLADTVGGVVRYTADPVIHGIDRVLGLQYSNVADQIQAQAARARATAQAPQQESYWNNWHYSDLWHNPGNIAKKFVPSTAFQITRSLPLMAGTVVGEGAPAAIDITAQTAQARAQNDGRANPNAWDYAIALPVGIVSAALFRNARLADVSSGVSKGALRSLGETATRDAAIGGSQAQAQYAGEHIGTRAGFNYGDMLSQGIEGGFANATMGVALHASSGAVMVPIRRMRDVAIARDGADYVDNVMAAAAASKARTQAPDEFKSFVDEHVKDGPAENLYIPADAITSLFQTTDGDPSPRKIEQDPFWSRYAPAVDEARQLGGDVVVPLSDAATHLAQSGDWKTLRDHVRFSPGGMSLAEAKEYSAQRAPEDIEKAAATLSDKMDEAAGNLQALRRTYQFGRDLGLPHDQAVAFGAVQRDWLMRRNAVENALRVQKGEQPLSPTEEWDALNLKPMRTTEEAFAGKAGEPMGIGTVEPAKAATERTNSLARTASWVIRNKKTGEVIMETFDRAKVDALNTKKYEAVPIGEHLGSLGERKTPAQSRSQRGPVSAMAFVRGLGGLRNDTPSDEFSGHDLRNVGALANHPGVVRAKDSGKGVPLDEAGRALHEAGYFPNKDPSNPDHRPTEAETLDYLSGASIKHAYPNGESPARQAFAGEEEHAVKGQLGEMASQHGIEADDNLLSDAYSYIEAGEEPGVALELAVRDGAARSLEALERDTGNAAYGEGMEQVYEGEQAEERGSPPEAGGERPEGVAADTGAGGDGAQEPPGGAEDGAGEAAASATGGDAGTDADAAQSDAFGSRPDDHANWLRGLAEERLRSDKEQKAPGSDGGLFDNNGKQDTFFQAAYHGSPHIFDKFSSDKIGTGEGAQVYGHGLYFAGRKEIADHYRKALAGPDSWLPKDHTNKAADRVAGFYSDGMTFESAVAEARWYAQRAADTAKELLEHFPNDQNADWNRDALREAETQLADLEKLTPSDFERRKPGRLYHVDIPEDHEYLLWDKPLSEQPEHVKEALAKNSSLLGEAKYSAADLPDYKGTTLYGALTHKLGSQEAASRALHEAGIAGIKYLDGGSRGAGDGTHNYVVFDDSRVSIKHYEQTAKGNISIAKDEAGNPLGAVIRSFEGGDVSTALHEMGHYWLEDLRARASRETDPRLSEDWQAVKDWFAENGHQMGDGEAIPEAAHELWARGVERYIMEGKAPSQSLTGAFARLAQWMRKLYQTVTALNAPISDKVREVMDRMLASDSEIEAARADMKIEPLEGAAALMTESERAAYRKMGEEARDEAYQQLLERVMQKVRTSRTREFNEQKRNLKDQVTTEVDAMPVHRVLRMLRKGEDGERVKLPKQWLIDNYGEDALNRMPKGVDPIFADEGQDPEDIAHKAGFDSADQMVRALEDHAAAKADLKARGDKRGPRQALIDEQTKQRVESDIPDPYQDIEQEARAAIANDKAGDLMSMEARAISRKTGQKPTLYSMAREWAKAHIQGQTTRDALTGASLARYSRAVAKAGKLAEEALIQGDFEQALRSKNQQILNAALLAEAKQVKEQVETASRKLRRIANARTIPSIDQDYLDQAHALLDQVRMGNESGVQVGRLKSFEAWYNEQVKDGREPIVPIEYSRLLGTQHWTSLKVSDLLELNDVVSQIVNLGRLKQTLLDGKERRDYEGAVSELVERQKENPVQRKQTDLNNPRNSMGERIKARFRSYDALNLKFEQLMNFMDNALPNGPWQRMLMNPLSAAQAKQSRLLRPLLEDLNGAIKATPKEVVRSWTREVDTPELLNWIAPLDDPRHGQPWRFTKDQLLAMALNLGNEGNKQRLLDGYRFNEEDVRAVLDRNLTEHDWKFVQNVFDTVGKLWPEIEEMERRVNGFAPEKVEATPIDTPHGTIAGGYFPAIYDPLYSTRADIDEIRKLTGGGFINVNTRAGATHERADAVKRPVLLSLSVVTRHLNEVVHDIAFREPAAQVRRLLKDDRIKQAITDLMGPEFHRKSLDYLENVAFPGVADSKQDQTLIAIARALNKRITVAGLGFRLSTILQQPTSFTNTMAEVGNVRYAKFFAKYLQSPIEAWKQVSELSEEMRDRSHNLDANISAMYEEHGRNNLALGPSKIYQLAFKGIAATDLFITIPGWMAAFDKATTDLRMNDDDAVHYADMVIRKTQGAGSPKDQAAVQRTLWMKAFNPFFSYWSAHYNQLRSIGHEARRLRDADHVFNLTNRFILAAILPMAIQGWFFGGPQNRDDGESHLIPQDAADLRYLLKAIAVGNLGALPGMNALTSHLAYGYDYKVSPWSRFVESADKTGHDIKAGYQHEEGEGDEPKSWIKDSFDSISYLTGKPLSQIGASLQGLYDYETDKAHPENSSEVATLAMKGKVPDHDR